MRLIKTIFSIRGRKKESKLIFFLLFISFLPIKLFGQCSPFYEVSADTTTAPGQVILTASQCSGCDYEWYDVNFHLIVANDTLQTTNSNTLYFLYVSDPSTGCTNEDPDGNIDSIYPYDYLSTVISLRPQWTVYCFNDLNYTDTVGYYTDYTDFINDTLAIRSGKAWAKGISDWGVFNQAQREKLSQLASPYCDVILDRKDGAAGQYEMYYFRVPGFTTPPNKSMKFVSIDNHSISYKRKNFPAGLYRIDIDLHDDGFGLFIDGKEIFSDAGFNHGHKNLWCDSLNENSTVEFRWYDASSRSIGNFTITRLQKKPDVIAANVNTQQSYCYNSTSNPIVGGLFPSNDAFISSADANTAYGLKLPDTLKVKDISGVTEYSILTFDLSGLSDNNINTAILNLTCNIDYNGVNHFLDRIINIYVLNASSWDEESVTWANFSTSILGQPIASTIIYQDYLTTYSLDVSNYVKQSYISGNKKVSFLIKDVNSNNLPIKIISKEGTNINQRPVLLINATEGSTFGLGSQSFQWQVDNNGNWGNISNATNKAYAAPSKPGDYRLISKNGLGDSDTTTTIHVVVPPRIPGHYEVIDFDGKDGAIKFDGYTGSIVRWESSTDSNFTVSQPIEESSNTLQFKDGKNLYFRALLGNKTCPVHADSIHIDFLTYQVISPGDDGKNDTWVIEGITNYSNNKVQIFNRFGAVVYSVEGYNNDDKVWKGKSNVSGQPHDLPDGTYFYNIEIYNHKIKTGFIELRRN